MHYSSVTREAFIRIFRFTREVRGGWLLRNFHVIGARLYFLFLYLHMARGLCHYSYVGSKVWMVGVTVFLVSMGVGFLGYVLPWGQMSFWGARVITNFFSVIPYFGNDFVMWL